MGGKGGNGVVAWRQERYLPKGGPCGGNGGRGGDVLFICQRTLSSLDSFTHRRLFRAENGSSGRAQCQQGRSGRPLLLHIPLGTEVREEGELLYRFEEEGERWTAVSGGSGGRGNASFATARRPAPRFCTQGSFGERRMLQLELFLRADLALVGLPNAGKSSLLTYLTSSSSQVGAYPFTTLSPHLGQLHFPDYSQLSICDLPGLISRAHQNRGLGLSFLKHVRHSRALLYVLDASSDPLAAWNTLRGELAAYDPSLLKKPSLLLFTKMDLPGAREGVESFSHHSLPHLLCSVQEDSWRSTLCTELYQFVKREFPSVNQLRSYSPFKPPLLQKKP